MQQRTARASRLDYRIRRLDSGSAAQREEGHHVRRQTRSLGGDGDRRRAASAVRGARGRRVLQVPARRGQAGHPLSARAHLVSRRSRDADRGIVPPGAQGRLRMGGAGPRKPDPGRGGHPGHARYDGNAGPPRFCKARGTPARRPGPRPGVRVPAGGHRPAAAHPTGRTGGVHPPRGGRIRFPDRGPHHLAPARQRLLQE